jgi:hypothetical protein
MLPRGLKVPVHLQALYTHKATPGGPAAPWSDAPFASSTLGAGVTLRWTLPDGLCRAEGDPPIFPSVPDLWLITRLYTTADGRRASVSWVLDSRTGTSKLLTDAWRHPVPTRPRSRFTCAGLQGADGALTELPAAADPALALGARLGYAPAARGRFAFFDALTDLPSRARPLAYLVVGWYSDLEEDPLSGGDTSVLNDLGWAASWSAPGEERPATLAEGAAAAATLTAEDVERLREALGGGGAGSEAVLSTLSRELSAARSATSLLGGTQPPHISTVTGDTTLSTLADMATAPLDQLELPLALQSLLTPQLLAEETQGGPPNRTYLHGMVAGVKVSEAAPTRSMSGARLTLGQTPAHALARAVQAQIEGADADALEVLAAGLGLDAARAESLPGLPGRLHAAGFLSEADTNDRLAPRWYDASPPAAAILGAGRGLTHGYDDRLQPDGALRCRLTGQTVTARIAADLGPLHAHTQPGPGARHLPQSARELLTEAFWLDPDLLPADDDRPDGHQRLTLAWLLTQGPYEARAELLARATISEETVRQSFGAGAVPPSAPACRLWSNPWSAAYIDYTFTFTPAEELRELRLEAVEHTWTAKRWGRPRELSGRALVSDGPARAIADSLRQLSSALAVDDDATLESLWRGRALFDTLDALTFTLTDWTKAQLGLEHTAGELRVTRARIIDTFGQVAELPASVPERTPLRLTARARLSARLLSPDGAGEWRSGGPSLAAVLAADPIEGALECFDPQTGGNLGQLERRAVGLRFQPGPGRPDASGPDALGAGLPEPIQSLVRAIIHAEGRAPGTFEGLLELCQRVGLNLNVSGAEGASSAHLLGRPLGLYRMRVRLESSPSGAPHPAIPLRIGAPELPDDGVLAVIPVAAPERWWSPTDVSGALWSPSPPRLRPDRPLEIWVLAALGSSIHLSAGLLPQKRITPSTDEAAAAARLLRPVLRAGLTLIGGQGPTTPTPSGDWTFCWREGEAWREAPARSIGEEARFDHHAPRLVTGWLRARAP